MQRRIRRSVWECSPRQINGIRERTPTRKLMNNGKKGSSESRARMTAEMSGKKGRDESNARIEATMAGAQGMMAITAAKKAINAGIKARRDSSAVTKLSQSMGGPLLGDISRLSYNS
jgi:hypothetical protein